MTDREARFHKIDVLVEESGHSYNPLTEQFEARVGSDAENNLSQEWQSFSATIPGVSEDELRGYALWKKSQAENSHYQELADEMIVERETESDGK